MGICPTVTITSLKYECIQGTCQQTNTGTYNTIVECQAICSVPPTAASSAAPKSNAGLLLAAGLGLVGIVVLAKKRKQV